MITLYELRKHDDRSSLVKSPNELFHYPGGEAEMKVVGNPTASTQIAYIQYGGDSELFELAMWADWCCYNKLKTVVLLPYFPGARKDRGVPMGVDVYADFLNRMYLDEVVVLDPHSDVMVDLIDNLTVVPITDVIPHAILDRQYAGVIIPDKGAHTRSTVVAELLGVPTFQAEKVRDFQTGKLSGFSCEKLPNEGRFLIADDICDGGGTFNGLASALKDQQDVPWHDLDLWVTHGIFSKGPDDLEAHFFNIDTTDSHANMSSNYIGSIDVHPVLDILVKAATGGF